MKKRWPALLLGVLTCCAVVEFVERGIDRSFEDSRDLVVPYLSARAWLLGQNPYDTPGLLRIWATAAANERVPLANDLPPVYPPSTLPVMAVVSWLPWAIARLVILLLSVAAVAAAVLALAQLVKLPWATWRGGLLLSMTLALAPLQTGLAKGNLGIIVGALSLVSFSVADAGRDLTAGLLLGVALAVKPLVAAGIFAFYVVTRRPRVWVTSGAVFGALSIVGAAWASSHVQGWWALWTAAIQGSSAAGGINDPTAANPYRYHLINLGMPLSDVLSSTAAGVLSCLAVTVALLALHPFRRPLVAARDRLVLLAACCVLSLLPVYHRAYDAVVILPAMVGAVTALGAEHDRAATAILLCCAVFFLPGASFLVVMAGQGFVPQALQSSWFWRDLLIPHQVWTLCLLAVFLIAVYRRSMAAVRT